MPQLLAMSVKMGSDNGQRYSEAANLEWRAQKLSAQLDKLRFVPGTSLGESDSDLSRALPKGEVKTKGRVFDR